MIKIGIELNGVVRNVNKQILKYYQKDINPSLDLDETDEKDDVFKYAKFESLTDKNDFIYIDYPYEIFGCAKTMSKDLPMLMNNWLSELTNYEDDDVEVSFFSLDEEALTIQSSYFFLSKIGTRVRKIIFPKDIKELWLEYDVVVSGNKEVLNYFDKKTNDHTYVIKVENNTNKECNSNKTYDSLDDIIKDEALLEELQKFVNNKNNTDGESN
jgi:hypothetical protein